MPSNQIQNSKKEQNGTFQEGVDFSVGVVRVLEHAFVAHGQINHRGSCDSEQHASYYGFNFTILIYNIRVKKYFT